MPKSKKHWIVNLTSEFFGTIFLTWMIALLGVSFNGNVFEKMISYTTNAKGAGQWESVSGLVIGFWVAMDVMLCLIVFSRWSCDLNPAVTVYRMLSKQNTLKYGFAKLGIQFIAGFAAAGLIIGTQALSFAVSHNAVDALKSYTYHVTGSNGVVSTITTSDHGLAQAQENAYNLANHKTLLTVNSNHGWSAFLDSTSSATAAPSTFPRHILAFVGELIGVLILIYPIFTRSIKLPVLKDIILVIMVGLGVTALIELKTVGWNPARALATTVAYDIVNPDLHATKLYWAYFFGPIAAPCLLYGLQKINVKELANHLWEKWLSFGSLGPVAPVDLKPTHTEAISAIHAYPHETEAAKKPSETKAKTTTKKAVKK